MTNSRVSRGRQTQELLASWFRERGWPNAQSRAASLPGVDVFGMPYLAPEVKATAGQDFTGALKQAKANAKGSCPLHNAKARTPADSTPICQCDLPFVVYRPKGRGPERIAEWLVIFSLDDATDLLVQAGYNDGQVQR